MPSLRGRIIKFLLQNRHWMQFQLKKKRIDWSQHEAILNFRQEVEAGAEKFGKVPKDIVISPVNIDGLYAEWLIPVGVAKEKIILYKD